MLKVGASAQKTPYSAVNDATLVERVKRVNVVVEQLEKVACLPKISQDNRLVCVPNTEKKVADVKAKSEKSKTVVE